VADDGERLWLASDAGTLSASIQTDIDEALNALEVP
jgi:hypothetical protein